jgi:transcriptional regulator with XRE-family HTH domain
MIHIGQRIKSLAEKKNLTKMDLAQGVQTTESNIYKIFANPNIDLEKLYKFSEILDVPITYLLTEDEGKVDDSPLPTVGKAKMKERKAKQYNKRLATELEREREARQKAEALANALLVQNSNLSEALLKPLGS